MLLEGELTFIIGGERYVLSPGDMWRIPGKVEHSAIAGSSQVKALDVFHRSERTIGRLASACLFPDVTITPAQRHCEFP